MPILVTLKLTGLQVAVWWWAVWVVVGWEAVALVQSERSEVVQCHVDALTVLCRNHPRSIGAIAGCRHVTDSLAWDVASTGRYRPDCHVVWALITTRGHVHWLRCNAHQWCKQDFSQDFIFLSSKRLEITTMVSRSTSLERMRSVAYTIPLPFVPAHVSIIVGNKCVAWPRAGLN